MQRTYEISITASRDGLGGIVGLEVQRVDTWDSWEVKGDPERRPQTTTLAAERCLTVREAVQRLVTIMDGETVCEASHLPARELAGVLARLDLAR